MEKWQKEHHSCYRKQQNTYHKEHIGQYKEYQKAYQKKYKRKYRERFNIQAKIRRLKVKLKQLESK